MMTTDDAQMVRCARCGGAVAVGDAKCSAARVAASPTNPTGVVTIATAPADSLFCSERCMTANIGRVLARAECSVCGKRWDRRPGDPGGDRRGSTVYCGDKCEDAHRKLLEKAAKELAKGRLPWAPTTAWGDPDRRLDKLDPVLERALALRNHWGRPGPHIVPCPDVRARRGLDRWIEQLVGLREQLLEEERQWTAIEQRREAEENYRRQRDAETEADRKWRDELA